MAEERTGDGNDAAVLEAGIAEALRGQRFALALKLLALFDAQHRTRANRRWSRGVRESVARALAAGAVDADRRPPEPR